MTYSIVALDPETGELGVGVQTNRPTVGAIVPWVEPGIGAVATQSRANVAFGRQALDLMGTGLDASAALRAVLAGDDEPELRQVGVIDAAGNTASHTGGSCIPEYGSVQGENFSAQANMMLNPGVPEAMASAYEASGGELVDRILDAFDAAQAVGGDIRGMQSAAILICPPPSGPGSTLVGVPPAGQWDLRIDNSKNPLADIRDLKKLIAAELSMREPAANETLAGAQAAYSAAMSLSPSDELTFWYGVRNLTFELEEFERAAEVLDPLFGRAPEWKELLHRLPDLPDDSPLRARFPRNDN